MLTDIQDLLLALCEDEPVRISLAKKILSAWYARQVRETEIAQVARSLTSLGYLKWHYRQGSKTYITSRPTQAATASSKTVLLTTKVGAGYLEQTRLS